MRAPLLTLAVLVAVSVSMTVVWFGHAVQTGVVLPEPDAPPARAAYLAEQADINKWLFLSAGLSWLIAVGAITATTVMWVLNRKRNRTEGVR